MKTKKVPSKSKKVTAKVRRYKSSSLGHSCRSGGACSGGGSCGR